MDKRQYDILKVLFENKENFRDPKGWDMSKILRRVDGYYDNKREYRYLFQDLVDKKFILESKVNGYNRGEKISLYRISQKGLDVCACENLSI